VPRRIDYQAAGKPDVLRMCMRQNRDPEFESGDEKVEDPVCRMREPPGALGDIVRRMKRRAALQRSATAGATVRDAGLTAP